MYSVYVNNLTEKEILSHRYMHSQGYENIYLGIFDKLHLHPHPGGENSPLSVFFSKIVRLP